MRTATLIMGAVAVAVCFVAAALVISNDHSETTTRTAVSARSSPVIHPPAQAQHPESTTPSSTPTPCGPTVSVGPHVSCAFAQNVARAYHQRGAEGTISAYSPATQRSYTMSCQGAAPAICTVGEGATVYIAP